MSNKQIDRLTIYLLLSVISLDLFRAEEPIMGYWGQAIRRLSAIVVSGIELATLTGIGRSADLVARAGARENATTR